MHYFYISFLPGSEYETNNSGSNQIRIHNTDLYFCYYVYHYLLSCLTCSGWAECSAGQDDRHPVWGGGEQQLQLVRRTRHQASGLLTTRSCGWLHLDSKLAAPNMPSIMYNTFFCQYEQYSCYIRSMGRFFWVKLFIQLLNSTAFLKSVPSIFEEYTKYAMQGFQFVFHISVTISGISKIK